MQLIQTKPTFVVEFPSKVDLCIYYILHVPVFGPPTGMALVALVLASLQVAMVAAAADDVAVHAVDNWNVAAVAVKGADNQAVVAVAVAVQVADNWAAAEVWLVEVAELMHYYYLIAIHLQLA